MTSGGASLSTSVCKPFTRCDTPRDEIVVIIIEARPVYIFTTL